MGLLIVSMFLFQSIKDTIIASKHGISIYFVFYHTMRGRLLNSNCVYISKWSLLGQKNLIEYTIKMKGLIFRTEHDELIVGANDGWTSDGTNDGGGERGVEPQTWLQLEGCSANEPPPADRWVWQSRATRFQLVSVHVSFHLGCVFLEHGVKRRE